MPRGSNAVRIGPIENPIFDMALFDVCDMVHREDEHAFVVEFEDDDARRVQVKYVQSLSVVRGPWIVRYSSQKVGPEEKFFWGEAEWRLYGCEERLRQRRVSEFGKVLKNFRNSRRRPLTWADFLL